MSAKDESADPPISNLEDSEGELKNNNTQDRVISESDANANEPQRGDGRTTEEVATLSSLVSHMEEQDKIIIWGTDSQYDDPELAEFEMLECQELEAYLVEEEEEHYEKDPGALRQPVSHNTGLAEPASMKDTVDEGIKTPQSGTKEQGSTLSQSKGLEELSSENDVFVSCLSTMSGLAGSLASALDYAGRTQATDSWQAPSEPYRTLSEDLTLTSQSCLTLSDRSRSSLLTEGSQVRPGKTTAHMGSVDLNLNSTALPEEPLLEAQETPPAPGVDRVPCKERSGLLINGMDECNRSTANAEREHNQSANAEQDTETQRCVPVNDHQLRNKTKADKEPDFDAKATSGHQSDCYQHVTANDTQPNQDRCGVKEHVDLSRNPSKSGSKGMPSHSVAVEPKLRKQGSFERTRSGSPSGLEKRPPWGSPSRSATPPSPKTSWSPRRRPPSSPARTAVTRPASQVRSDSPQKGTSGIKPPSKSCLSSAIPKPIPPPQPPRTESECKNTKSSSPPQKPKNVRPKIITYVRKNSQVKPHSTDGPYEVSTLPPRLTPYASPSATKEQKAGGPKASAVLSSANILYDKYRQEMQKAGYCSSGLVVPGIRPPNPPISQRLVGEAESYHGDLHEKYLHEVGRTSQLGAPEVTGVFRSPRTLRPQLGLGAVARQPSGKTKGLMAGQRSALVTSHPPPAAQPTHHHQDPTVEQKRLAAEAAPKAHVAKAGQSGLRLPGFSSLPVARLAAFGFVRSASVSSVSSNQSTDSTHSDPCRPASRLSSGSEDPCLHRASAPLGRSSPQPPNAPAPTRRTLPPPPRSSPVASRKESQTEVAIGRSASSSPKRFAVVSPKPQSPVRQKSCVASLGGANVSVSVSGVGVVRLEEVEAEHAALQRLRERCVEQARELLSLQAQLRKAALGLEVFAITTQHFCLKSEATIVRERELSLELARIRDEVAASVSRWERVQGEKEALEERFAREVQGLREQQQKELGALQDRLSTEHSTHTLLLQEEQQHQLRLLHSQHQEQVEAMSDRHETVLSEMESTHNSALATLQEEHARTVKNLRMAHEQQRKSLEEDFEKLRLSLQDQVDTLTFQNRSLRDRAKRFEEALRRSTDEQIVDALAPYQHIEEDLRSLKEVLEMKNQQIHEQELKIAELEKMAQKNVHLEERVQVLQQQNEDLKARIDLNVATSRQLSEENANLQEYVEKESNEKKRLSRTNEELMWRLQTGELSPHMSPTQSPLHRPSPGPASPSRPQSLPR